MAAGLIEIVINVVVWNMSKVASGIQVVPAQVVEEGKRTKNEQIMLCLTSTVNGVLQIRKDSLGFTIWFCDLRHDSLRRFLNSGCSRFLVKTYLRSDYFLLHTRE